MSRALARKRTVRKNRARQVARKAPTRAMQAPVRYQSGHGHRP